ncbi:MAG: hypothetical protein KAS94_01170, partial [Desulfobulbaceae bacterium]|nr:hypothetical protein [Desulfobulbaceae bacterium]
HLWGPLYIARWRQKASAMGRELDSLADVISFGVSPAIIAYGCGMQGLYDRILLAGFTLHPLVLTFALSGSLMISRIHIPKI